MIGHLLMSGLISKGSDEEENIIFNLWEVQLAVSVVEMIGRSKEEP